MRINMLEGRDPIQDADKENNNGSIGNYGGYKCRPRNNKKDAEMAESYMIVLMLLVTLLLVSQM